MGKVIENRKIVCRYGNTEKIIEEQKNFGWVATSRVILNRFGKPLPLDTKISEQTLISKCSVELTFVREVEEEKIVQLNSLQVEYEIKKEAPNNSPVLLWLLVVALFLGATACCILAPSLYDVIGIESIVIFIGSGAVLLMIAIVLCVVLSNNENEKKKLVDEKNDKREALVEEAKKILESKGTVS